MPDEDQRCQEACEQMSAGGAGAEEALRQLRGLAAGGHAESQYRLGLHIMRSGGSRDEAAAWCEKAAEQGLAQAQFNLGLLLMSEGGSDLDAAGHWLRLSAANGLPEAESCLDLIHAEPGLHRPRTWDEAETRLSVALAHSDQDGPKAMRFAEYYVDPCIDLLTRRYRISREQSADITQQFFLELEERLSRGPHRGRAWKASIRAGFDPSRPFRPYLGRILRNFAHDWLRQRRREAAPVPDGGPVEEPDLEHALEHHREYWASLLDRFAAAVSTGNATASRAVRVLDGLLREAAGQQEMGRRLGVSERTVRSDHRLATELLCGWLRSVLEQHGCVDELIESGLGMLPDWLHHPIGARRARALLFLALAGRRLGPVQGT